MSHIFGPVPSRRLGWSLGVDLIPGKTCTYNCLYCEVGPTTHLTLERRPFRVREIKQELEEYLAQAPSFLDFITLAGSGEPTLNAGLGEIIAALGNLTAVPVAVLTNGSLCHLPEVRAELAGAQVVLPSLDAGREETFRRINRPHPALTLELVISGLKALRREFRGQIWLEIMLLKGINDTEAELLSLKERLGELAPDRVQLNTAVRPVADPAAQPLSREEMEAAAAFLGPGVEVIAARQPRESAPVSPKDQDLLAMVARRPMTARDLARALGESLPETQKRLGRLAKKGLIQRDVYQEQDFYRSRLG